MPETEAAFSDREDLIFVTMRRGKLTAQKVFDLLLVEKSGAEYLELELVEQFASLLKDPEHVD